MSAALGIQTFVGDAEPLDRLAANDVLIKDLVDIVLCNAAIPDAFWIDDYRGTVLALVHATGLVGADSSLQSAPGSSGLEEPIEFPSVPRVATSTRMLRVSMIGADENVSMKWRHWVEGTRCKVAGARGPLFLEAQGPLVSILVTINLELMRLSNLLQEIRFLKDVLLPGCVVDDVSGTRISVQRVL